MKRPNMWGTKAKEPRRSHSAESENMKKHPGTIMFRGACGKRNQSEFRSDSHTTLLSPVEGQ